MNSKSLDVRKARQDTPGCEDIIHFNNAGASLMPEPVYNSVIDHLALERKIGGYEAQAVARRLLDQFYTGFAALLNAKPTEIAYVENATRAWDMAFYSIPFKEGDRVITHASEYVSNYLAFLQLEKRLGIKIDLAPSDASGQIDVNKIPQLITPKTKLIALTHVPTQGGMINPAIAVGKIAKEHEILYLLDACQSVGQINLDVNAIQCDFLSGTGRKFLRGPRGTGFLYVSDTVMESLDPPFIDLHAARWSSHSTYEFTADAKRFENWESYVAGRVGLSAAVQYALQIGMPQIEAQVKTLAAVLRNKLSEQSQITIHDLGIEQCGIVTFTVENEEPSALVNRLRKQGINTSVSVKESAQLDFGSRQLSAVARASVHYYNTEEEVNRFCEVLI